MNRNPSEDNSLPDSDPAFGPMNRMLRLVHQETDRSLVLSMAAFVEDALKRLLLTYLRPGKAAGELLEGFNAPLGTLSARIKICSVVGLLTATQHADLELARKIRNEFAHGWEPCMLSEPRIAALVDKMSGDRIFSSKADSPKERFHLTVSCALMELESLRNRLHETKERIPMVGIQLMAGDPVADYRIERP